MSLSDDTTRQSTLDPPRHHQRLPSMAEKESRQDSNPDRNSVKKRNEADDETEEIQHKSRKDDRERDKKVRYNVANEDQEKAEPKRHRSHKYHGKAHRYCGEADIRNHRYYGRAERRRHRYHGSADDKIVHKDMGERDGRREHDSRMKGREVSLNEAKGDSRNEHDSVVKYKKGIEVAMGKGERDSRGEHDSLVNYKKGSEVAGRSGGVYIPPFKLARLMYKDDKSSLEYQRKCWDALKKSINGLVNKVNFSNMKNIVKELFAEDIIRGRGLFCRSCVKSQMASPGFTDVFASLVAVVNTKFPEVGHLLLRRIIVQLQRAYKRNDKPQLLAAVKFIAHLVNQQVVHELIALELLTLLLEKPTDDSVEVAVGFVTECGSLLQDLSPQGLHGIFERFRGILHEGEIDKRIQFLIEGLLALRKAKFQLDLVEQEDQVTHEISLRDEIDTEVNLDIFKPDPQYLENEKRYEELKKQMLGEESEDEADSDDGESEEEEQGQIKINDETEQNLINLRRTIYLTIMSSVDFEDAGHKLLNIKLEAGQEMELCVMLLQCCSQERTYSRYYGLLGQRFCMINKVYQEKFEKCFMEQYSLVHRLETNKLRNVAKFFAHLLATFALPWHVLAYLRLTEEDTSSSSRIFIKILFQDLCEHLGIRSLNEHLSEPAMQDSFESIFPKETPQNARFAINFLTSTIGLGGITENLRNYLKNVPRLIMQQQASSANDSDGSGSEPRKRSHSDSVEFGSESRKRRRPL